jgi:hypothetical protein
MSPGPPPGFNKNVFINCPFDGYWLFAIGLLIQFTYALLLVRPSFGTGSWTLMLTSMSDARQKAFPGAISK